MNDSLENSQAIYRDIHKRLVELFPPGTIEMRENDPESRYIPVQPYIQRLEEAAGTFWSWRLTGDPIIFEKEDQVMVRGVLKVVEAEREGIGFANFQRYPDTGKIKNLKYAINSAASDALRDACNLFGMGWKDLAPYRKWAQNPGAGLMDYVQTSSRSNSEASSITKCIKCQKALSVEDELLLKELNIRHRYCQDHIPKHLRRER